MEKDTTLENNPTMDDDYLFSACCQDCTGLIPNGMHNDWELENYEKIYPYLPQAQVPIDDVPVQYFPGEAETPPF